VIIPAYNAADTVSYALRSCVSQSAPALEVLVVDDGSTDNTAEIVGRFGAPVRLIRQPNRGPGAARNAAASEARGEWLAFLDADDWWMPNKLERQLELAGPPGVGIIHSLANVSVPGIPDLIGFEDLWKSNLIVNSSVLIRKATFDALGGFVEHPDLLVCEDYNLWLRAAAERVGIRLCRELLTYYRPGHGISSNPKSFFEGSDRNIGLIAARYNLDLAKVEERRSRMMLDIGLMALGQRDLPLARSLLKEASARKPHVQTLFTTAVAHLPDIALDLARRSRGGYQRSQHRCIDDPTTSFTQANATPIGPDGKPALLIIIDTEEEFDWTALPPPAMGVHAMRHQQAAYRVMRKHGIVPTYAVDYMIAGDRDAYAPLLEFVADGGCEIGSQLHTWVNPPFGEARSRRNTYAGNLPAWLEFEKIALLTQTIEDNLGIKPILYRGGRYGAGPYTARILKWFGYKVDCTVLPYFDLQDDGGPDYRRSPSQPGWRDPERQLLEIPATVGMSGLLRRFGRQLYPPLNHPLARQLGAPSILRRLGILDRNRLTPEGASLADLKRLARDLVERDRSRVLVLSFHSSSLQPGNTPYVRTARDLDAFLGRIDDFLGFFMEELHGVPITPACVHALASGMSGPHEAVVDVPGFAGVDAERTLPA
jgi:glycosyltransferase involved in cell wall biosynthesis